MSDPERTTSRREAWISAHGGDPATSGAGWTDASGRSQSVSVGWRGHDVVQHPLFPERFLLIGRHPGRQFVEVNTLTHEVRQRVPCSENHELGGHACFSADGQTLFVAESKATTGEGRISVRDGHDYRLLDEYPSHGVGPHEILLMPDGRTLAIANGGLLTHPDNDHKVLNLETMRSTLTFIDSTNGERLDEHRVSEPKASIRHLAVSKRGEVAVALQMQREGSDHENLAPLAALYDKSRGLRVLSEPEPLLWHCNDYMGSTRINDKTRTVGFTSPRGNIALFWDLESGELKGQHRLHDVCGLAVNLDQSAFILSNSTGQIRSLDASTLQELPERRLELPGFRWDNHLRAVSLLV